MFRRTALTMVLGAGLAGALAGCGVTAKNGAPAGAQQGPISGLRFMVPNSPGGGYDTTARALAKVMDDNKIGKAVEVFNLAGAGGTVGLARTVQEKANGKLIMMMGLGVVGAQYTNKSTSTLAQTTPIAKVIEEAGAIVVPKASPYTSINDLVEAWKKDPKGIAVGGGSSPGGPDHLLPMQLARAVGIDPRTVNFVAYDGGGDLLPAILGGKVGFAASGFGEFLDQVKAGTVRVLALSGAQRVAEIDAPTFKESGIDLVFTNWRGIVAPGGLADGDRTALVGAVRAALDTADWKAVLEKHGWTPAPVYGDEFGTFLTQQTTAVADVLKALGLA